MQTVIAVDAMGSDRAPKPEIEGVLLAARHYNVKILLALPVKQVCSAGCKGLCPHCGRNLNVESCDCVNTISDPRWAALEDIRKKLER